MAISTEQIWAAADALEASGEKLTLEAVRKAIGGGSYATISPAVAQWRKNKAGSVDAPREPVPTLVAERLQTVAAEIWAAALGVATQRLAAEREALHADQAELEGSRQEAAQLADQLVGELDECKRRVAALQEVESALRSEIGELKQSLAAETASSQLRGKDIEQLRSSADLAHQREVAAREELAEMRGRVRSLQEHHAELLTRLPAARP